MNQRPDLNLPPKTLADALRDDAAPNIVDVRSREEFAQGRIRGSKNIPLEMLAPALDDPASAPAVVFVCESGSRSLQAANFALIAGYSNVQSLEGGLIKWRQAFPSELELP